MPFPKRIPARLQTIQDGRPDFPSVNVKGTDMKIRVRERNIILNTSRKNFIPLLRIMNELCGITFTFPRIISTIDLITIPLI